MVIQTWIRQNGYYIGYSIGYYWICLVEIHFAFTLNIEIVRSNLRGVQGARKFLTQLLELARPVSMWRSSKTLQKWHSNDIEITIQSSGSELSGRQLHVGRNWWQTWPKCGAGCWAWGPGHKMFADLLLCFIMKEYKRLLQYGTLYTIGIYWNDCRIVVITRIRSHVSACCSLILARFIVEIVISLDQALHRIRAQSQHIEGSTSIPPGRKADASESRWI